MDSRVYWRFPTYWYSQLPSTFAIRVNVSNYEESLLQGALKMPYKTKQNIEEEARRMFSPWYAIRGQRYTRWGRELERMCLHICSKTLHLSRQWALLFKTAHLWIEHGCCGSGRQCVAPCPCPRPCLCLCVYNIHATFTHKRCFSRFSNGARMWSTPSRSHWASNALFIHLQFVITKWLFKQCSCCVLKAYTDSEYMRHTQRRPLPEWDHRLECTEGSSFGPFPYIRCVCFARFPISPNQVISFERFPQHSRTQPHAQYVFSVL